MPNKKWFLPSEVVIHNDIDDCWVIIHDKVFDLTRLLDKNRNNEKIIPILAFAGKEISHWFDEKSEFKTFINPKTQKREPFTQYGPLLHLDHYMKGKRLMTKTFVPWWKDKQYVIGYITKNPRTIIMLNTLTEIPINLRVCEEETFNEIGERYKIFHSDCFKYSWWYLDRPVDMSKTLLENGIEDEREKFLKFNLPTDFYIPVIVLMYNDDCSIYCEKLNLPIVNECYLI